MPAAFPNLSTAELETLLVALDPQHGDPGSLAGDLADPSAFLARIGLAPGPGSLGAWLERWRASGGSREALLTDLFTRPQNWLEDPSLEERCRPHQAVG